MCRYLGKCLAEKDRWQCVVGAYTIVSRLLPELHEAYGTAPTLLHELH